MFILQFATTFLTQLKQYHSYSVHTKIVYLACSRNIIKTLILEYYILQSVKLITCCQNSKI